MCIPSATRRPAWAAWAASHLYCVGGHVLDDNMLLFHGRRLSDDGVVLVPLAKRAKLADRMTMPKVSLGHTSPTFVFRNWLQSTIAWAVPVLRSFSSRSLRRPPLQLCQLRRQSR